MPIYEVEISVTLVVEADNELAARRVANQNVDDAVAYGCGYTEVAGEVTAIDQLPCGWSDEDIPFGGSNTRLKDLLPPNDQVQP